jgi:hypothetical protein
VRHGLPTQLQHHQVLQSPHNKVLNITHFVPAPSPARCRSSILQTSAERSSLYIAIYIRFYYCYDRQIPLNKTNTNNLLSN